MKNIITGDDTGFQAKIFECTHLSRAIRVILGQLSYRDQKKVKISLDQRVERTEILFSLGFGERNLYENLKKRR